MSIDPLALTETEIDCVECGEPAHVMSSDDLKVAATEAHTKSLECYDVRCYLCDSCGSISYEAVICPPPFIRGGLYKPDEAQDENTGRGGMSKYSLLDIIHW